MNKTKIEWTDYTWNPITGCFNNCWYCYGRAMNKRFGKDYKPRIWSDRLNQPLKEKKPSKIFVCSIADLFGDWIPTLWIIEVLKIIAKCPQHTFQLLTKNPRRLRDFSFPKNCWLGMTITDESYSFSATLKTCYPVCRFISFEPLLGEINLKHLNWVDWIIIGALTGKKANIYYPREQWIRKILDEADRVNIPVFMKNNLKKYWEGEFRQEFPTKKGE